MTHSATSKVIKSFSRIASSSLKKVSEFSMKGIQNAADFFFFEKLTGQKFTNTH